MTARDDLAREIFIADNSAQSREVSLADWAACVAGSGTDTYAHVIATGLIAAGYTRPRTITTVEELDALPRDSIVAVLTHSRNVPITVVFQRGSNSEGGGGWCTPEAMGQITTGQVFEYIGINCLPYEFTVLH